jgi:hypothetical protein
MFLVCPVFHFPMECGKEKRCLVCPPVARFEILLDIWLEGEKASALTVAKNDDNNAVVTKS